MSGQKPGTDAGTDAPRDTAIAVAADAVELPERVSAALAQLDDLVQKFEQHPEPAVQQRVMALLQAVDGVHRAGLGRLVALLEEAGWRDRAHAIPEVRLLVELYQLDGTGDHERAELVLDSIRPYIESHGGRLEIVSASGGVIAVRLSGACHGCPGSAATLHHVVEQTLRDGLSDFVRMDVLEPAPAPAATFVSAAALEAPRPRLTWQQVMRARDLAPGSIRGLSVADERVLVANVDGEFYAYRNACPGSPLPLDRSLVDGRILSCPWHGCRFDLRGGRRQGPAGPGLGVVPITVADGEVRIGILAQRAA